MNGLGENAVKCGQMWIVGVLKEVILTEGNSVISTRPQLPFISAWADKPTIQVADIGSSGFGLLAMTLFSG